MSTTKLSPLPSLPSSSSPRAATNACECGCGTLVAKSFAPGHDARLCGWVRRVLRGVVSLAWIAENASKGEAEATRKAIEERKLRGIKWGEELAAMKARLAKEQPEPEQATGTDGE